jgi:hypothetical protein
MQPSASSAPSSASASAPVDRRVCLGPAPRAMPRTLVEPEPEGPVGVAVLGTVTVGAVEAGGVAVGGTAVVGAEAVGATVPGCAPEPGVVVAGVVAAGVVVAGAVVVPWTRAVAGIGNVGVVEARPVVPAAGVPAGAIVANTAAAATQSTVVRARRTLRLARAIIALAMLTVVWNRGDGPVCTT